MSNHSEERLVENNKDMLERLDDPQTLGFAVLANIISIIASIKLLTTAGSRVPGSQDWQADPRVLESQKVIDGPLSFMNGSNGGAQAGYTYTAPEAPVQNSTAPVEPSAPAAPAQNSTTDDTNQNQQ